jgi:hypothetical protein
VTWALDRDAPDDRTLGLLIVAHLTLQATNDRTIGVGTWALRACHLVHDAEPWIRCAVVGAAAEDLRGRSEFDAALELARPVVDDATPIGDGLLTALTAIGSVVASRGDPDVALDETLRVKARVDEADSLPFHRAQVAVLAAIWAGFGGHSALAEHLADEALAIARTEGTPSLLATATVARGNALHDTDPDEALRCYEESIAHTRSGATAAGYSTALSFASLLWHRAGDSGLGLQRAIECVETMWAIGDYTQVPDGLASGAVILVDRDELQAAATLLGGAEHPLIAMPPIIALDPRWKLDEVRAELRSRLGDGAYETARRRGMEMSTEDFVVYAIDEMRRVQASISSESAA